MTDFETAQDKTNVAIVHQWKVVFAYSISTKISD